MRLRHFLQLALLSLAGCARVCATGGPAAPVEVTLVFTGSVAGQLEPCGCSPGQKGGVARAAGWVAAARKEKPHLLLVDGGDALSLKVDEARAAQSELKAETIAQAMKLMRYDVTVLGERDRPHFGVGDNTLHPGTGQFRIVEAGGTKVGFVAFMQRDTKWNGIRRAREEGAPLVVSLLHVSRERAAEFAEEAARMGADVVLNGHDDDVFTATNAAVLSGAAPFFALEGRGQSLLRLDITLVPGAPPGLVAVRTKAQREEEAKQLDQRVKQMEKRIAAAPEGSPLRAALGDKVKELEARKQELLSGEDRPPAGRSFFNYRFVELGPETPEAPEVRALIARYDEQVFELNRKQAEANATPCAAAPKDTPYAAGVAVCADCHDEALAFWKTTGHSHAYETLEKKKKHYDLDCVGCHVTAWNQPAGPCRVTSVKDYQSVQCEACHGPGSAHAEDPAKTPIARQVGAQVCVKCHEVENSPHFEYASYLKKILGPGHGAPVKK